MIYFAVKIIKYIIQTPSINIAYSLSQKDTGNLVRKFSCSLCGILARLQRYKSNTERLISGIE